MTTTVTINNLAVEARVLEGVTIRYGRDRIDDTVPASSCSLQLLAANEDQPAISLRDLVVVKVDGTTVFRGKVTDRQIDVPFIDSSRIGTIQSVIAIGALSELGRILVGTSAYPSELDGARISRVLTEAAPLSPTVDSIVVPISTYDLSFDSWASAGLETIDPGTVTLNARTGAQAKALELVDTVTTSAGSPGLYETPAGLYGYADARRRSKNVTPITLDAAIIGAAITSASRVGDLINSVTVAYGTASPQATYTSTDTYSTYAYGTIAKSIGTELSSAGDAADLANRITAVRADPRLNLEAITVYLDHPTLDPSVKAALTGANYGTPVTLTGLDARMGLGTSWQGFIEGWTLTCRQGREAITLNVSARVYSLLLATVSMLSSAVDRLEGSVAGLAELWAPDPKIDSLSNTLDSLSAISIDRAYKIS
jgi:hypothetical protein